MSKTGETLTTDEVAGVAIANAITVVDPEAIERWIADLDAARVPLAVARATALRKALQEIEKFGESRITSERIIKFGGEWTDPDTGVVYVFKGDRAEHKIADLAGCKAALLKAGAPGPHVNRAIYDEPKADFRVLAEIAKSTREFAEIIEDFEGERKWRPAHLQPKE